jgi:hypothetical protein
MLVMLIVIIIIACFHGELNELQFHRCPRCRRRRTNANTNTNSSSTNIISNKWWIKGNHTSNRQNDLSYRNEYRFLVLMEVALVALLLFGMVVEDALQRVNGILARLESRDTVKLAAAAEAVSFAISSALLSASSSAAVLTLVLSLELDTSRWCCIGMRIHLRGK